MNPNFSVDQTQYLASALGSMLVVMWTTTLILSVIIIISNWKMFKKAGEPGIAAIVPFWNTAVLFKMTWGKWYFMFLMCIPFVNIIIGIMTIFKLAKVFGKGVGFGFGLLFLSPIFMLILGFGSAQYVGIYGQNFPAEKKEMVGDQILVSEEERYDAEEQESFPLETKSPEKSKSSGRSWSV